MERKRVTWLEGRAINLHHQIIGRVDDAVVGIAHETWLELSVGSDRTKGIVGRNSFCIIPEIAEVEPCRISFQNIYATVHVEHGPGAPGCSLRLHGGIYVDDGILIYAVPDVDAYTEVAKRIQYGE